MMACWEEMLGEREKRERKLPRTMGNPAVNAQRRAMILVTGPRQLGRRTPAWVRKARIAGHPIRRRSYSGSVALSWAQRRAWRSGCVASRRANSAW